MFNRGVKKVRVSSIIFFLTMFFAIAGCSDKDDSKNSEKKVDVLKTEVLEVDAVKVKEIKIPDTKTEPEKIVVSKDIMIMLNGTDPCFEAVEFVRDEGDLNTYRALGDKIILEEDYVERHGHKTYIGTIGKLLKEDRSVEEIRQVLLNKCRAFGVAYEKASKEQKAKKAEEAEKAKQEIMDKKESS